MRKSVLSGLFACAVTIGVGTTLSTQKAGAIPLDSFDVRTIVASETAVDHLLAVADTENKEAPEIVEPAAPKVVTHQIAENENLSEIAKKYDTTWKRIYDKNEAVTNPDSVSAGLLLIIPEESEELESRELPKPVITAPVAARAVSSRTSAPAVSTAAAPVSYTRAAASSNLYAAGNCTWHAKSLRPDLPNNLGNARTWTSRAAAQGIPTGRTPRVGAIANRNNHVAYVTGVNGDGTITISDMNYRSLYAVTNRTVPANQWTYIY